MLPEIINSPVQGCRRREGTVHGFLRLESCDAVRTALGPDHFLTARDAADQRSYEESSGVGVVACPGGGAVEQISGQEIEALQQATLSLLDSLWGAADAVAM